MREFTGGFWRACARRYIVLEVRIKYGSEKRHQGQAVRELAESSRFAIVATLILNRFNHRFRIPESRSLHFKDSSSLIPNRFVVHLPLKSTSNHYTRIGLSWLTGDPGPDALVKRTQAFRTKTSPRAAIAPNLKERTRRQRPARPQARILPGVENVQNEPGRFPACRKASRAMCRI